MAEDFRELGMLSDDKIDSLDHILKADKRKLLRKVINSYPKQKRHGNLLKNVSSIK